MRAALGAGFKHRDIAVATGATRCSRSACVRPAPSAKVLKPGTVTMNWTGSQDGASQTMMILRLLKGGKNPPRFCRPQAQGVSKPSGTIPIPQEQTNEQTKIKDTDRQTPGLFKNKPKQNL